MPDGVLLLAQGGVRGRRLRPAAGPARLLPARADPGHRAPARRQHRLRPPPAPLGGGADARLARPLAQAGQGLRGAARGLRDHGQAGDDPAHAAPPRPPEPEAATRTLTSQTASKGGVAALLVLLALGPAAAEAPAPDDLAALKARFARPATVPFPADDPSSAAKVDLGRRLFHDPSLSRDGRVACASCHDAAHAFSDPRQHSLGVTGRPTARHAPPLLDLAWARTLFWDGRAPSLETQVRFPVEHPDEMGERLGNVAGRLAADPGYAAA